MALFAAKRPVLRAVVIFCALMGAFYSFEVTELSRGGVRKSYLGLIARASGATLGILGHANTVDDTTIRSPRFSVQIVRECDGTDPAAAFVAAVVASPGSTWAKIAGIACGTAALLLVNLVRVVSLFYIGVYFPSAFKTAHLDMWQPAFIVLAVAAWAVWVQWATRNTDRATDVGP